MSDVWTIVRVRQLKVQGDAWMTINDRDAQHPMSTELSEDVAYELGHEAEGYFRATWTGKSWVIRGRVADQSW